MKRTVLVVDDDPLILRVVATVLDLEEFDVVTATSAGDALAHLEGSATPDLVVSDVMMPGIDGLELCKQIRAHPVHGSLPVILLTARDSDEDRRLGEAAGGDAYLTKPFSPLELIDEIDRLLDDRS